MLYFIYVVLQEADQKDSVAFVHGTLEEYIWPHEQRSDLVS